MMNKSQIQVLLIEDNLTDVIFLREALGEDALTAFEVTVIEHLNSAIEILQRNLFDIILLDLGLPDGQGLETFTRLNQIVPHIPKVILSGLTDETLAMQAVHAGAQDYLVKGPAGFASAARAIRYAIERGESQKQLRAREERFRALIENGADDISLLDANGTLIWESPAVVRNLGYAENTFVGKNIFEIVHPDDRAWTDDLYAKLIQKPGSRQQGTFRLRRSDGTWRWVEAVVHNLLDNPSVQAIVVNYHDITERKQAELERQALLEIMQGLVNKDDLHEFLKLIHDSISSVIYAENFFVVFHDKDTGLFEEIYSVDKYDEPAPPSALEKSITSYVFRSNEPLLLTQTMFDKLVEQGEVELVGTNSESWMGVPLKTQNGTIGVIAVQDYENPNRYTEHDKDFLALIGSQVALAIERKQAERKLREEQEKAQKYLDIAGVVMLVLDQNGTVTLINQKGCEILGCSYHEIIGKNWVDTFLPPATREEMSAVFQHLIAGKIQFGGYYENTVLTKNGEERIIAWHNTLLRDSDGKIISSLSSGEDITERKQIEASLRASEVRYRLATLATRDVIWEWRPDTGHLTWAENAQNVFGYPPEEVGPSDKWWDDHIHPEDRERVISKITTAVDGSESIWLDEYRFLLKDSTYAYISDHGYIERDISGKAIRIIGAMSDITQSKQAEEKLRENAADETLINQLNEAANRGESLEALIKLLGHKFEPMFSAKGTGLYLLSADGKSLHMPGFSLPEGVVRNLENLIGRQIPPLNIPIRAGGTFQKFLQAEGGTILTEPQEIQAWMTEFTEGETVPAGLQYLVSKLLPKIFRILGIRSTISLPLRSAGKTIGLLGLSSANLLGQQELERLRKISSQLASAIQRKQDEQRLFESNERFEQLANNIEEAFWITAAGTRDEIYLSPASEKIWGMSLEELMNSNAFLENVMAEDRSTVEAALIKQNQGEKTEIEYRTVGSDGTMRWIWDRAFPIFDDSGKVVRLAGIAADITERKQSESEVTRHLAELEALYENGLAVGRLLNPSEIGERIITTFARHLAWHHVAIRLIEPESAEMKLIAFNQQGLSAAEMNNAELLLNSTISKVGQGLSGWVVQTGQPLRTGNVYDQPQYIATYPNIRSGLYMPLKLGDLCIGVISVESEEPNAFTEQDERLLATLANQATIAFENARLYQSAQQELMERKRAETALRTSETHYRELADSITDILFELDQNLHYSHWNKASELLTGIPAEDAIGKSMRDIFGYSSEQSRIEKIYASVLVKHQPRTFETLFIVNNQPRSFEVNAYPSVRGVAVVAKDVTERKRSETIMQKRFELMEFAARHSLEEIMQMATDEVSNLTGSAFGFFHILEADQATPGLQIWPTDTLNAFNVPLSEGRHRPVEQAGVWAEAIRQRRAIIHNDYEALPVKKDLPPGHAPIIRELVIPIIRNEKILAVMGIANKPKEYSQQDLETAERFVDYAWDITERKQMEVALSDERNQLSMRVEERTADLSRANSNLARALRVKDEFLANMSHELRTPLNAILGLSESLAEQTAGPLNEKQQRYINTVNESGHHLLSLINDILDLAKIEAGQITLDLNKVEVNSVCQASLRMIKQLAQKKRQEVVLVIDSQVDLMWADERRLKQMLVNLLGNAVKFTPEGGKLGLEVHGDQDANKVTFTIWDTGIGIKETDLPRLFQPFVQLDAGLAREASGTGLGLALVAQMARLHGGSASVTSQPGQGSRFTIMLPWEPALASETVERLKTTGKFRPMKFDQGHKPTVLLIEDTEEVIMMLSDYLESNGYKIVTARDGVEGVIQAQLAHPDLILMDIQMPRMDGFEATKKLRSEPQFEHTPIIALTALAMPNDRELCLAAGMDEYITKPVHLRALVKVIEKFLSAELEIKPQ